ncbi:MAG: LysE family transporter [Methanothrix sp.]|nr:LysE family transporter [Methanothrix sp.]
MEIGFDPFLRGLVLGLAVAMPVGPISLLCLHRTIAPGRLVGFASGIGAASADAIYAATAGFSIWFLSDLAINYRHHLQLAGGLVLCLMGLSILNSKPSGPKHEIKGKRILGAYASIFLLTLANPATILFFMAAFSSIKVPIIDEQRSWILLFVVGTLLGSSIWWLVLSSSASLLDHRISQNLRLFNTAAGSMIILLGLFTMANFMLDS